MRKMVSRNSRKGLTLPVAMAVGIFLVLIASSLLFIAISSTSRTGSDVSGRQAYLNVRSALDYARAYYNSCEDLTSVGDAEYMIMKDIGGTTNEGATISKTEADTANAVTYVIAQYFEAKDSNPATLKLSAFSRYTDPFGNKGKTARLSVTYTVGSSAPTRYSPFVIPGTPPPTPEDRITLHVKQPKDMNYQLSYYVWTYEDNGHAYDEYYDQKIENTSNTFDWYPTDVSKFNTTTTKDNIVRPNGVWATGDNGKQGPPAVMATTSDDDLWTTGSYVVKKGRVPWFNIIFAQKGSVLSGGTNIYNSQTNELFHLWYLDPSDKNIYFEFTGQERKDGSTPYITKYYMGKAWDGRQGLEYETDPNSTNQTTVLAYVKNPKTAVHLRIAGQDENSSTYTIPSGQTPVITYVSNRDGTEINTSSRSYLNSYGKKTTSTYNIKKQNSSIYMQYEGCGWWVANVETNKEFNLSLTVKGVAYQNIAVKPNSSSEAWLILKNNSISAHQTEASAVQNGDGTGMESYVTVHAKIADYNKPATPSISFKNVGTNSSAGKVKLQNTVIQASQINSVDYTTVSYNKLADRLSDAILLLNDKDFINNQTGTTYADKERAADIVYDQKRADIESAVKELVPAGVTAEQIAPLDALLKKAEAAIKAQNDKGIYDYEAFQTFTAANSPYKQAKAAFADVTGLTSSAINNHISALTASLNDLNDEHKLVRSQLGSLIEEAATLVHDEHYTQESRDELDRILNGDKNDPTYVSARAVFEQKFISQSVIDGKCTDLIKQMEIVRASLEIPLDTSRLQSLIATAQYFLSKNPEKINCTDESYNALQTALDNANDGIKDLQFQDQVVALEEPLSDAIDNFTVTKPAYSNDMLAQGKKIKSDGTIEKVTPVMRVYIKTEAEYPFELSQYASVSDGQPTAVSHLNMSYKQEPGYYYYDVSRESFNGVSMTVTKTVVDEKGESHEEEITSEKVLISNITDGNILYKIAADGTITQSSLTALYLPNIQNIGLRLGQNTVVDKVYEAPYFVYRFEPTTQNAYITVPRNGSNIQYSLKAQPAGEFIVKLDEQKMSASVIDVAAVYPKLVEETTQPQPKPTLATGDDFEITEMGNMKGFEYDIDIPYGKTCIVVSSNNQNVLNGNKPRIWAWDHTGKTLVGTDDWDSRPYMTRYKTNKDYYYYVCDATIQGFKITTDYGYGGEDHIVRPDKNSNCYQYWCAYANKKKVYKVDGENYNPDTNLPGNVTSETFTGLDIEDGKTCIILNATYGNLAPLAYGNRTPMIYVWGGASGGTLGAAWPGQLMNRYGNTNYFTLIVDGDVFGFKLNYQDGSPFSADGEEGNVHVRNYNDPYYKYIVINPGASGTVPNVTKEEYPPVILIPKLEIPESAMDGIDIPMPYVGGTKVRITNRPYHEIYGSGKKSNDYGYMMNDSSYKYGGDVENNNSGGRVGASQLSSFFDWYEVKIPIPQSVKYTFELKGMNPDSPDTKTIQINDVYGDIWLAQYDNTTMTSGAYSNVDLLSFNLEDDNIPENLKVYFKMPSGWSNLSVSAHGTGDNFNKTVKSNEHLTRGNNSNVYYINGITKKTPFITFTVSDNTGNVHTYNTALAGGNYLMFDPLYNNNYGGWREFISDNDRLKSVLRDIMADYYGHVIVNVYDENGEVVDKGANTYYYCYFLWQTVINNNFFHYAGTGTAEDCAYQMNMAKIDGYSETTAYNYYVQLKEKLDIYRELYNQLAIARKFIANPIAEGKHSEQSDVSNGRYPEYVARKDQKQYSSSWLATLKEKYKAAETAYLDKKVTASSTAYLSDIYNETNKIKRAIANSDISSEGAIGCLLYDAQSKVDGGSTFKIQYRETRTGTPIIKDVPERNPENYPIIFIEPSNSKGVIYDVQFIECTIGGQKLLDPKKDVMRVDDDIEWVFFDSKNCFWTPNSNVDYRQINSDIFVQESKNEKYEFEMHKKYKKVARLDPSGLVVKDSDGDIIYDKQEVKDSSGRTQYEPLTLLFTYDAEVYKYKNSSSSTYFYTIKAGAYTFNDGYTSPMSNGKLDIFSDNAKNFFTNSGNYGKYVDNATDAVTNLHWHDGRTGGDDGDGVFKTGYNSVTNRNVNFEVQSGDFLTYGPSYTYYTNEGFCFRWSSDKPLYTATTPVVLQASEFRFSSMGTFDGTKNGARNPQFLLKSSDPTATSMQVTFITDVNVKYDDAIGGSHMFSIRQGTYVIEKADPYSDYIANIYDETYWKSMEHCHPVGNVGQIATGLSGTNSKLTHGSYGR